jgi:glucose-1-phosphatase
MTMLKNLIFDLGDVIVPIDLRAPLRNFAMLANMSEANTEALWKQHGIWQTHETGLIDDDTFRAAVREIMNNQPDTPDHWADEVIDTAWNSVLLELPVERIERILELAPRYRLFLLSNTNAIHIREVNQRLVSLGMPTLEGIFERVFYSHDLKMVKPNPDIFQHVLREANLMPEETAFFDDNAGNINAAAALGIQAVHVVPPKTILDYLRNY